MDAVNPEVLEEALRIQGALLGPGTSCDSFSEGDHFDQMAKTEVSRLDGDRNKTLGMPAGMFFHSPLLYWNCSLSAVQNDMDLLQTVNSGINRRSAANVTLRWGSVFAGKRFRHQQLIGADALVISLFYQLDSRVGELWDQRATYLAKSAETHKRYEVYPSDGREKGSTLYEVCRLFSGAEEGRNVEIDGWDKTVPVSADEQVGQYYACELLFFHVGILGFVFTKASGREVKVGPHRHGFDSGTVPALDGCAALIQALDRLFNHVQLHDIGPAQGPCVSRS